VAGGGTKIFVNQSLGVPFPFSRHPLRKRQVKVAKINHTNKGRGKEGTWGGGGQTVSRKGDAQRT